jgi:hypothetical protein
MVFAGDGLNSSPGVQLQQGVDSRVPIDVGRYGLDSVFILSHDPPITLRHFQFVYTRPISNSTLRMRCHNRTAKRLISATMAIFFFFGLRDTSC